MSKPVYVGIFYMRHNETGDHLKIYRKNTDNDGRRGLPCQTTNLIEAWMRNTALDAMKDITALYKRFVSGECVTLDHKLVVDSLGVDILVSSAPTFDINNLLRDEMRQRVKVNMTHEESHLFDKLFPE